MKPIERLLVSLEDLRERVAVVGAGAAGIEVMLALLNCGDHHAVASWGVIALEGRWVWRRKDRIDRQFVARYRLPALSGPLA